MGTADTSVLWEANSAVWKKMACFNLLDGGFYQLAKFPTLFCIDGCLQILNFGRGFRTNTTRETSAIPVIQE